MKVILGQETHTIKTPVVAFTLEVDEARALVGALDEWSEGDEPSRVLDDDEVESVHEMRSKLNGVLEAHDSEVRDKAMGDA